MSEIVMILLAVGLPMMVLIGITIHYTYPDEACHVHHEYNVKQRHLPPRYHSYHGRFWHINRCKWCGTTGMSGKLHISNCCPNCGETVLRAGAAKWTEIDGLWGWYTREELEVQNNITEVR